MAAQLRLAYDWVRTKPGHVIAGALLAVSCAYAVVSLQEPFGWDHGIMSLVGDAMARGGLPFRDAWDMKGPVAYAPFTLAQLMFGHVMWGIRVMDLLICVPALYFIARRLSELTSPLLGLGASLAVYLWLASAGWFFTAQPEVWVTMATAVACMLTLRGDAKRPVGIAAMACCGALIALTGLVKPFYLAFGLAPLTLLAVETRLTLKRRFVLAVALAAGAATPIALIGGYLVARGGLEALIEVQVRYGLTAYNRYSYPPKQLITEMWNQLQSGLFASLAPFVLIGLWTHRRNFRIVVPLLAWLFAAMFCVAIQGKLYTYQWFPLYAPVMVAFALGVHVLAADRTHALSRTVALAACLVVAVQVAAGPAHEVLWWARSGHDPDKWARHFKFQTYSVGDEVAASRYLREHTQPEDRIFVWGIDATVEFLANRRNSSRFVFDMPLSVESGMMAQYRDEVIRDLDVKPPVYIVVGSPWRTWRSKDVTLSEFPRLEARLQNDYALETSFGNIDLYRRQAAPSG